MKTYEIENIAASIYDGGWRSKDKGQIMEEYGFTKDEAEKICKKLKEYEVK